LGPPEPKVIGPTLPPKTMLKIPMDLSVGTTVKTVANNSGQTKKNAQNDANKMGFFIL
jgi:hypothetical protein